MPSPQDEGTRQPFIEQEERQESHNNTEASSVEIEATKHEQQMKRYYWRSLCLCLIPPFVAAYFLVIWLAFLRRDSGPVKYGSIKEIWVYYSWFVISVFGIGWSKYGLAGVEMAMLQSHRFGAPDTATLVMHSGTSWSGPDGWLQFISGLLRGKPTHAHRLWFLFSFLSALPFIAFPISGLCMELSDGYISSAASPMTIGYNSTYFNNRQYRQTVNRGTSRWESGSSGQLPGIGILYTPDYLSRDEVDGLDEIPNRFPMGGSAPELFVAPQAENPIAGRVWGLRMGYNCSVVDDISQFTIVTDKSRVSNEAEKDKTPKEGAVLSTGSGGTVYAYNSSAQNSQYSNNLFAYLEIGINNASDVLAYDGSEPNTFDPRDISRTDILEMILWQVRLNASYELEVQDFIFNETIDEPVKGAPRPIIPLSNGIFQPNITYFDPKYSGYDIKSLADLGTRAGRSLASPIGLRCTRFSALGHADLDAKTSTFHNFTLGPYPYFSIGREEEKVPRFGFAANRILQRQYFNIFDSISSPTPTTYSNSVMYRRFLQARELQQSAMLAHAMDALQLMYDGVTSFENSNPNPNITSSRPGKVLEPGIVPALFPVILFLIWAIGCVVLGLRYGFVRRGSNTLDGYYMLSVGVNLNDTTTQLPEKNKLLGGFRNSGALSNGLRNYVTTTNS